ncbi:MAG: ATP-binding protein [Planctomycetes bacterium]|nr:ATP-binding protein [Planctomycetota bacterium]
MNTAGVLEAMTDRGAFELLATSVLRLANPDYKSIIHTGLNAHGETIVSPVDGICLIPHSKPSHYVIVQHTTKDRDSLRQKWISAADSDLNKAKEQARQIRQELADATFTLVLATNQRVSLELAKDVTSAGAASDIAIDVWDQHRISHFLDNNRDGHWLRKKHLGVEAERLSTELFRTLCRRSVELYRRQTVPVGANEFTTRDFNNAMKRELDKQTARLCLLVGPSGFGKSVSLLQIAENAVQQGNLFLWIPADVLQRSCTFSGAIEAWFHELHPKLEDGAENALASVVDKNLTIVVDDVNQSSVPARLIEMIVGATRPANSKKTSSGLDESDAGSDGLAFKVLVPLWPASLEFVPESVSRQPFVSVMPVPPFSDEETIRVIRASNQRLSEQEALDAAKLLSNDPFLVGSLSALVAQDTSGTALATLCSDVIGGLLRKGIKRAQESRGSALVEQDVLGALQTVAIWMLRRRALQPTWNDVAGLFPTGSNQGDAIRCLIKDRYLCFLDDRDRLIFRHDRLRDQLLVQGMQQLMAGSGTENETIFDPYFARILGQALIQDSVDPSWVALAKQAAPLALFESIRFLGTPQTPRHEAIKNAAIAWCKTESISAPGQLLHAVDWTLKETDSTLVPELVQAHELSLISVLAGLRNGSIDCGFKYVRGHIGVGFQPGCNDAQFERIALHASKRHLTRLQQECNALLDFNRLTDDDVAGWLGIIGHLELPDRDITIRHLWEKSPDKRLDYAIWAAARCPVKDVRTLLDPMLEQLTKLPTREPGAEMPTDREEIPVQIGWGFAKGITTDAMKHLIHVGRSNPALADDVSYMLERVDHPDAMEYVVQRLAAGAGSNHWSFLDGVSTGPMKRELFSKQTADRLATIWRNTGESEGLRRKSFGLWLIVAPDIDLSDLQQIRSEEPIYLQSIQTRAKLGDATVVPQLIDILRAERLARFWWTMTPQVWTRSLLQELEYRIERYADKLARNQAADKTDIPFTLAQVLCQIPPADAEETLKKFWTGLQRDPHMIATAFRVGTTTCAAMAAQALSERGNCNGVFSHVMSTWAKGHSSNPLTVNILEKLEPFASQIPREDARWLFWECTEHRHAKAEVMKWAQDRLLKHLPDEIRAQVKTPGELLLIRLDSALKRREELPFPLLLMDRNDLGPEEAKARLQTAKSWFDRHLSCQAFLILAECVAFWGTRHDVSLLMGFEDPDHQEQIKAARDEAIFAVCHRTLE